MESPDRVSMPDLLDEVRTLRRNLLVAVKTLEQFVERKQAALARLAEREAEFRELRTHHLRLTGRHEQTVILKDRLRSRLDVAVRHARRWRDEAEEAQRLQAEATARRKTVERALAALRKREAVLRKRLDEADDIGEELAAARAERDEARRSADLLRTELGEARQRLGALEAQPPAPGPADLQAAEALSARVAELERELTAARDSVAAADGDALVAARVELAEQAAKLDAVSDERDRLGVRLGEAEEDAEQARAARDELADRLAAAEEALAEARQGEAAAGGDADARLAALEQQRDQLAAERDQVAHARDRLADERDLLAAEVDRLKADLRQLRSAAAAHVAEDDPDDQPAARPATGRKSDDSTNSWKAALGLDPPTEGAAPAPLGTAPPPPADEAEADGEADGEELTPPAVNLGITPDMVDGAAAWLTCDGLPSVPLVPGFALTLGRKRAACDIVLPDRQVSRTQARLFVDGSDVVIEDLSKNGTFVNGERIVEATLQTGDVLAIGRYRLTVSDSPDPAAPPLATAPVYLDEVV